MPEAARRRKGGWVQDVGVCKAKLWLDFSRAYEEIGIVLDLVSYLQLPHEAGIHGDDVQFLGSILRGIPDRLMQLGHRQAVIRLVIPGNTLPAPAVILDDQRLLLGRIGGSRPDHEIAQGLRVAHVELTEIL